MVLADDPVGQERSCECGARVEVGSRLSMPEADKRVREWCIEHAKTCALMRAELAAQGGPHLSS